MFGKQDVYEPNFAHFLGDFHFHFDILLAALMNLQKYICVFWGETGREPAIHVKHRTCMTHDCMAIWQENNRETNRKKKYIAYRGLILFYHRGKGPLGGTLAIFFG